MDRLEAGFTRGSGGERALGPCIWKSPSPMPVRCVWSPSTWTGCRFACPAAVPPLGAGRPRSGPGARSRPAHEHPDPPQGRCPDDLLRLQRARASSTPTASTRRMASGSKTSASKPWSACAAYLSWFCSRRCSSITSMPPGPIKPSSGFSIWGQTWATLGSRRPLCSSRRHQCRLDHRGHAHLRNPGAFPLSGIQLWVITRILPD